MFSVLKLTLIIPYQWLSESNYLFKENASFIFFSIRDFFHRHLRFTGKQKNGGGHLYFSLPLPPVHQHLNIHLQLCMRNDYHLRSLPITSVKWEPCLLTRDLLTSKLFKECIVNQNSPLFFNRATTTAAPVSPCNFTKHFGKQSNTLVL